MVEDSTPDAVAQMLEAVAAKGVTMWLEAGQLRYRAPKGALSAAEVERLRASKDHLVRLLEANAPRDRYENAIGPRQPGNRGPLTFSQLAHWHQYRLNERHAIRQIAAAVRLIGELNLQVLEAAITEVVRRHEALRTRIVLQNAAPVQEVFCVSNHRVEQVDLTTTHRDQQETALQSHIDRFILEPVDVSTDSLFGTRLLRLQANEHVLLVVMEHMISDAASLNIFSQELLCAYKQLTEDQSPKLAPVGAQLGDYAQWQQSHYPEWHSKHGEALHERLSRFGRLRFPLSRGVDDPNRGWGDVPVTIDSVLKAKLVSWCKARHSTLPAIAFAAFACLTLRWCKVSEAVIRYQSDGRLRPEVQNTIGYLASVLYVPVQLTGEDSWQSMVQRTTAEYFSMYQHADFSDLAARENPPEITKNSSFNWVRESASRDIPETAGGLAYQLLDFNHPMIEALEADGEPSLLLYEHRQNVRGHLYFPRDRFSTLSMVRFADNYIAFLEALVSEPDAKATEVLIR